ncbi:hypothetical protein HOP50_16g76950 [Chloropicon primus]|uniref:Uncharacterized protein n=1 Tax=Chloropicon primus TaxID=1764295 RepID=A0A5B8MWF3_9CHLO|nr:hypothetical protein A3770_16p76660 [Chloropicon primus]UPR04354.1 hypothetical protein HOP50_16g76950 [Chloropicon primus]|eukprot:QDZ25148.1 hypothetical protein A3770_16p76660 [Chloropicon primus]
MELFDSYLTRNVFETSVENVPPLIPLFKAFEKQKKKHLIKGFNASDFDESCQSYYEDSASMSGDFDQDFYARVEAGGRNRECLYDGREQDIKTFLNQVTYRMYLLSVDLDGGSSFKYISKSDGKLKNVPDFNGAVRIFTNTFKDKSTGRKTNLWHTVVSETAHRFSIGFEIPSEQIVALLDSCEGCWEEILWDYYRTSQNEAFIDKL